MFEFVPAVLNSKAEKLRGTLATGQLICGLPIIELDAVNGRITLGGWESGLPENKRELERQRVYEEGCSGCLYEKVELKEPYPCVAAPGNSGGGCWRAGGGEADFYRSAAEE